MSKAPRIVLQLAVVIPSSAAMVSGCGDPYLATIAVIPPRNSGEPPRENDAGAGFDGGPAEAGEAPPADAGADANEHCVELIDQLVPDGRAVDAGEIPASTLEELGCEPVDMMEPVASTGVYWRKDGEPIVAEGEIYSLRWRDPALFTKLRVSGGDAPCESRLLYEEIPPPLATVGGTCRAFRAPDDLGYLRLRGDDHVNILPLFPNVYLTFQLCQAACPPNTVE